MTVFVYEHITGGGLLSQGSSPPPDGSLLAEGAAMLGAVSRDLLRTGAQVCLLRDARLHGPLVASAREHSVAAAEEQQAAFLELAANCDASIILAPELGGALLSRRLLAETTAARVISPGVAFVQLASDKQACSEWLTRRGVKTPEGVELDRDQPFPEEFPYPAVLKPIDGAGSFAIELVRHPAQAVDRPAEFFRWRLERFCPGQPVSVAMLSGPSGGLALPPCRQRLSEDGRFQYLGGALPLPRPLAARAQQAAIAVAQALPPACGYWGIDMVLGESADQDAIIEVNPRLTTSYVGLAAAARDNLAEAMLAVAGGEQRSLSFFPAGLEFDPSGNIRRAGWQGDEELACARYWRSEH